MPNNQLQPQNRVERGIVEYAQEAAKQVSSLAMTEVRKADEIQVLRAELRDLMERETGSYPEGSDALQFMHTAHADMFRAERIMRARGETNGH